MPTFGSQIDADGIPIINVGFPEADTDAATKGYVDGPIIDGKSIRERLEQAQTQIDQAVSDAAGAKADASFALTSAGGKNKVTYATSKPLETDPGVPGDTWFVWNDLSWTILEQWVCVHGDGTSGVITDWASQEINGALVTAGIDAGRITAGTIDANRIGAKTLSVEKLVVSDLSNLMEDGGFENSGTGIGVYGPGASVVTIVGPATGGTKALQLTGKNGTDSTATTRVIDVVPGDTYYVECQVRRWANTAAGKISLNSSLAKDNGTATVTVVQGVIVTAGQSTTTWSKLSGKVTIPDGMNKLAFQFACNTTATAMYALVDDVVIRKASDGKLIVDGSITADSLTATLDVTAKTFNGGKFIGNTFQTAQNVGPGTPTVAGVIMDPDGIRAYKTGASSPTVNIAKDGNASFSGTITSGTITGTQIQSAPSGQRLAIGTNASGVFGSQPSNIAFWDIGTETKPGIIGPTTNGGNPELLMFSPANTTYPYRAIVYVNAGSSSVRPNVLINNPIDGGPDGGAVDLKVHGTGYLDTLRVTPPRTLTSDTIHADATSTFIRSPTNDGVYFQAVGGEAQVAGPLISYGGTTVQNGLAVQSGASQFLAATTNAFQAQAINATASAGTAVQINTSNTIVFRASSGRKHKRDIHALRHAGPWRGGSILDLEPVRYRDRHEVEMFGAADKDWKPEPRWWIGWTAEDFAEAGWEELITRDPETNEPDYLHYDRVLAALVPELRGRFEALESENETLHNRVAALEARLDAMESK